MHINNDTGPRYKFCNQKIERNKIWVTPIMTLIITLGVTWIAHIIKGRESKSENINETTTAKFVKIQRDYL